MGRLHWISMVLLLLVGPSAAFVPPPLPPASSLLALAQPLVLARQLRRPSSLLSSASHGAQEGGGSSSNTDEEDACVIGRVRAWIQNMVIGLKLCPFAEGVVMADTVRYIVSKGRTPTEVCTDVMTEALRLVTSKEELVATTVIIAPKAFVNDFPSFYETELFLEEHLEESPLGEDVLVACFHPQYTFGGEPDDAPIHYEKRSPFPVFNLLRAQRVWQYANEGKTAKIASNNAETLERTGIQEVRRLFALEAAEARAAEEEEGEGQ